MTTKISIDTDTIQLDQFLKWAGVLASGGEIRQLIEERRIRRNGEIETAKRRRQPVRYFNADFEEVDAL